MSFSSDVKEELFEVYPKARHCQIAETAGITAAVARAVPETGTVRVETENEKLIE